MPRPNKTFSRIKAEAGSAWKRGERKEAYTLWEKAAAGIKELHDKSQNKKKRAAAEKAAAESSE